MIKLALAAILLNTLVSSCGVTQSAQETYDQLKGDCDDKKRMWETLKMSDEDGASKDKISESAAGYYACDAGLKKLEEKLEHAKAPKDVLAEDPPPAPAFALTEASPQAVMPVKETLRPGDTPKQIASQTPVMARKPAWYEKGNVSTFFEALDAEKELLPWKDNSDWQGYIIDIDSCAPLMRVCSLNVLKTLSMFLTINGKGMFPPTKDNPVDGFVGNPDQIARLVEALTVNRGLFNWGDISAEKIRNLWINVASQPKASPRKLVKVR
jgi:hypothetical protein